jgi:hypothetical protein
MADEWRVRVSLPKGSRAAEDSPWAAAMRALPSRVSDDVKVSQTPGRLFLYAATAAAAARAEQVLRDVLAEHEVTAAVRCDRWNSIRDTWTSHEDLMAAEREKSVATGRAAWQVRVDPSSYQELKALARRLEAEGFSVVRRWQHLITGADCEDDAYALADQVRGYSSADTRIRVQPGVYERPAVRVQVPGTGTIWV